jgi:hypothetical protein
MHLKFRLFVGSVLLSALSACGQGAPTAPASTVAATGAVPEGSAAGSGSGADFAIWKNNIERVCGEIDVQIGQYGDGVYAVRGLTDKKVRGPLLGFSWVQNIDNSKECLMLSAKNGTASKVGEDEMKCEVMHWMIVKSETDNGRAFPQNGGFPINVEAGIVYCFLGNRIGKFEEFQQRAIEEAKKENIDSKYFDYGLTVTFADICDGSGDITKCKWPAQEGSGSGEPK